MFGFGSIGTLVYRCMLCWTFVWVNCWTGLLSGFRYTIGLGFILHWVWLFSEHGLGCYLGWIIVLVWVPVSRALVHHWTGLGFVLVRL